MSISCAELSLEKLKSDGNADPSQDRVPTVTVAATGQAASAESLQHQTPSLENLLAR